MPIFVKVIASLGPASNDVATIFSMVKQGVAGFRINFSHGTPEEWLRYVDAVRSAERGLVKLLLL